MASDGVAVVDSDRRSEREIRSIRSPSSSARTYTYLRGASNVELTLLILKRRSGSSSSSASGTVGGDEGLAGIFSSDDDTVDAMLSDGELGPNRARCRLAVSLLTSDAARAADVPVWSPVSAFGAPDDILVVWSSSSSSSDVTDSKAGDSSPFVEASDSFSKISSSKSIRGAVVVTARPACAARLCCSIQR